MLSRELTYILTLLLPSSQLLSYHAREQLLCLNERNLNVSVRVTVEAKLTSYICWQRLQYSEVVLSDGTLNECNLLLSTCKLTALACSRVCKNLVQLCDELLDSWDELDQALWDENSTEVVAISSTVSYSCSDVCNNIIQ